MFFGSRGSLDEPERASIQPDFMPQARDIDALPPQHSSYVLDVLFSVKFYRGNNDTNYF